MKNQKKAGILSLGGGKWLSYALTTMLALAALWLPSSARADVAWAEYDSNSQTLTFKYGATKTSNSGTVTAYDLNNGSSDPGWKGKTCTKVVFEESFSNARPTSCYGWFYNQKSLTAIEGLEYLNTEEVTNMTYMFYECEVLESLDVSNFNTEKVTSMKDMFDCCFALKELDLSSFNTANVTSMVRMFSGCSNLATIYVSDKFVVTNVVQSDGIFTNCMELEGAATYNGVQDISMANCTTGYFSKKEAWAQYDSDTQTLTFKYGKKPSNSTTVTVYDLNSGETAPGWQEKTCTTVEFDKSFSGARPTSCYNWFYKQTSLTSIKGLEYLNTEKVTTMLYMFFECSALESLDVSKFNTANVTNMNGMFEECAKIKKLDVSNFNTEKVTDMGVMFFGCSSLKSLDLSNFNTANVTKMGQMFYNCSALTTIYGKEFDIDGANTDEMFLCCDNLKGAASYNAKKTDGAMANYKTGYFTYKLVSWAEFDSSTKTLTFKCGTKPNGSETLTVYDLGDGTYSPAWNDNEYTTVEFDASFSEARPTSCFEWFSQEALTSIKGMENFNTEKVVDMNSMFYGCSALEDIDLSNFNTASVIDMGLMFGFCSKLKTLDVTSFNTGNVTNMAYMFNGCDALTTIYASDNFVTTNVTNSSDMFSGSDALVGAVEYTGGSTDASMANYTDGYFSPKKAWAQYDSSTKTLTFKTGTALPEGNVYELNSGETAPGWQEQACTTVEFDKSFSVARPTSCFEWFKNQSSLTNIKGLEYLNTKEVTTMLYMFFGCTALESLDASHFNTEKVTNMNSMFEECEKIKELDLSSFNTEKVTDMGAMFFGCTALESLDLSNFNTANTTKLGSMFSNCPALTTIYAKNFNIDEDDNTDQMFNCCENLKGAVDFDATHTDGSMANCETGYFKVYYKVGDTKYDLCGENPSVSSLDLYGDEDFVTLVPFTVGDLSFDRIMSSNWGTLCVPFEVDETNNTNIKFYKIKSVGSDLITLTQLEGKIAAGTPMLVYSTLEVSDKFNLNIYATKVTVGTAPADGTQADGWQLVGSFTETEVPDNGYIISKNKFWLTSDLKKNTTATTVKTKGMRAWLKPASNSGAVNSHVLSITLDEENEPTAVDAIEALTEGKTEIYDLQGRRLDSLQKGLNIVKTGNVTKKVMVE